MGCFRICFGICNNHKVSTKHPLPSPHTHKVSKPVVHVSKSLVLEFNCRSKLDILIDNDNKEKESRIYDLGNRKSTILANEKEENSIGTDKFLDYSLLKLEGTDDRQGQKVNGLYNVRQLLQEESSDSLFSVSVGWKKKVNAADKDDVVHEESSDSLISVSVESKKKVNAADKDDVVHEESSDSLVSVFVGSKRKVNAADNDDVVQEESSDSLFSVSVETRKQCNGLDNVDQLNQEESSDSLFSVSLGSKKKVNVAENGDVLVQEESSDSLFSESVESRKQLNGLNIVDQLVQEESSDSLFSVSVGSKKKANAAENGNVLVQEESFDSLFSVSLESRKQVNAVETDENEVNSSIAFGLKHSDKHLNSSSSLGNSVLGPIENLIKLTDNTCIELKEHEKENMSSLQGLNLVPSSVEEPSFRRLNNTISKQKKGSHLKAGGSPFAVDTSLSSWLVKSDGESSENTSILAAFT